ncbi:MAG: HAMP domain-containing histidine kinase [Fimbriimonadaceae bacterium]|nr:HAMP domain-containing histidine kinase [Fimbriimonadaceae bacterium]
MKSLGFKLVLWNVIVLLGVVAAFAYLQGVQATNVANDILDDILMRRAEEMNNGMRRDPEGRGPRFQNPNEGQRPPDASGAPNVNPVQLREPGQPRDPNSGFGGPGQRRGPPEGFGGLSRVLNAEGRVINPPGQTEPLDRDLFERSLKGETVLTTVVIGNQRYRMLSMPRENPVFGREVLQLAQENSSLDLIGQVQWNSALSLLPLVIVAAGVAAWLLARLVLRPVQSIAATATKIAEQPDLKERISVGTDDEIGQLADALNTMTGRLQEANERTHAALEQQRRFSSDAAHELRTPLAAISLAAENALHPAATAEEKEKALGTVSRLSAAMTKLTSMLLALARLDSSSDPLPLSEIDVASLAEEAIRLAGREGDSRILVSAVGTIHGNRDAVVQILRNLLDNSVAHSPADAPIEIGRDANTLWVRDSGEGIPKEHIEHLFERFYRVDASRSRATGGYGLGLSIVRSLANSMGAQVQVRSQVGTGTTFFIIFPGLAESSQNSHEQIEE